MSLKDLATMLVLGTPGLTEDKILATYEYRKGKTLADLKEARKKGLANGHGKVEWEIDAVEAQLDKVLKRKKKK